MSTAYQTWKATYPLHAAAQLGNIEEMKAVQEIPTLINGLDVEKWTPLHYCVFEGHHDAILWLIENGADISLGNHFGSTPLHIAIGTGNIQCVELLLKNIKSKDILLIKNEDKQIPRQMLMIADSNQKEIRLLLDQKEKEFE